MSSASLALSSPVYGRRPAQKDVQGLIREHMPLVKKIAWHVHGRVASAIDIEDLAQIGMVALVEAANAFEDRGYAFATYASMRIRGAMIDKLRAQASICRSAMGRRRELAAARARIENQLGRHADEAEMAEAMGLDAKAYRAVVDGSEATIHESLDDIYSDHSMWFADVEERADDTLEREALRDAIEQGIKGLPEREALILQLYFVEELNLEEIAQVLGVSGARVCQIKKAALDRLRGHLADWD